MGEQGSEQAEAVLPESDRRRGQRSLIRCALSERVRACVMAGTVPTLFLLWLGAAPIHIGLASTARSLCAAGSLVGLWLLNRTGKAKLMIVGRLALVVPVGVLIGVSLAGHPGGAWLWVAIAAVVSYELVNSIGQTSWWPMLQDNTTGDKVGAFFARMRVQLRAVEIVIPLGIGWYLGQTPSGRDFCWPYGLALAMAVLAAWFLRNVPERPVSETSGNLVKRFGEAFRIPSVRKFLRFCLVTSFVTGLSLPFWVVMLNDLGLGSGHMVWLSAAMALGNIAFTTQWGRLVDKHGGRSVLTLSIVPQALMGLAWLMAPADRTGLLVWAMAFHLAFGFLTGGLWMGQTIAAMKSIPMRRQSDGFALWPFAGAIGGAAGAFLGGMAFQYLSVHVITIRGVDGRLVYLGGAQVLLIAAWWASRRLACHEEETPTRDVVDRAFGRIRRVFAGE